VRCGSGESDWRCHSQAPRQAGAPCHLAYQRLEELVIIYQLTRRVNARTTSPVPIRVPPPITSRTTSRPVNGSESECVAPSVGPLVCVVETVQVCRLYAWHVGCLWPARLLEPARRS